MCNDEPTNDPALEFLRSIVASDVTLPEAKAHASTILARLEAVTTELAEAKEQIGIERLVHMLQEQALRTGDPGTAPRWDEDPIVIENGWLTGHCPRCRETLADELKTDDNFVRWSDRAAAAEAETLRLRTRITALIDAQGDDCFVMSYVLRGALAAAVLGGTDG